MKALSIRQPWCWFILCGFPWWKRFENRKWDASYAQAQLKLCPPGSNFLIHASKGMTQQEFDDAIAFARRAGAAMWPQFDTVKRGGIVGMVKLVGIVRASGCAWFTGPTALELAEPYPLPFEPCTGALGFFEVGEFQLPARMPERVQCRD